MDAPTEWTYGGKLDWSSADSLKLVPIGMGCRCIIEALKERAEAANYTLPAILTADYNPFQVLSNIIPAIQSSVTALLALFCNHTDNGGDWSGLSYVAPAWTEADILTTLEIESRLSLAKLNPISAAWAHQQYQILSLLKWIKNTFTSYRDIHNLDVSNWKYDRKTAFVSSDPWFTPPPYNWETAESYYNESFSTIQTGQYNTYVPPSFGAANGIHASRYTYDILRDSKQVYIRDLPAINKTADFYIYTQLPSLYLLYSTAVFDSQGDSFVENAYNKAAIIENETLSTEIMFDWISNLASVPPNRPTQQGTNMGWSTPATATATAAIIKFDGANGFKFRDW